MTEYYQRQLEDAQEYQDFVQHELAKRGILIGNFASKKYQLEIGENSFGMEIKHDKRFREEKPTGSLYIECYEKASPSNKDWVASGIHRDDNSWLYAIGDYSVLYIFGKNVLRLIEKQGTPMPPSATSIGFTITQAQAEKYASRVIHFHEVQF